MQNALHLISESRRTRNTGVASNASFEEIESDDEYKNLEINIKLAKMLIKAGCNMNHRDLQLHETPIYKAIVQNDLNLVKLFIIEGIDVSLRNIFGNDALSRSIQLSRLKIARLLVDLDAPIRKATCFYKMPSRQQDNMNDVDNNDDDEIFTNGAENMLMVSLANYEEFLKYLRGYTHDRPRSLVDLARLKVRKLIKKPISSHTFGLNLPNRIYDYILLKDLE